MTLVEIETTTKPIDVNPDLVCSVNDDGSGARIGMANGEVYFATATRAEVRRKLTMESF